MSTDHDTIVQASLDALAPNRHEPRDWADVMGRAKRSRRRWGVGRRLVPATGVAALVVVAGALFVQLGSNRAVPSDDVAEFSVLDRPQTDVDRAAGIGVTYAASSLTPESARLVATKGELTYHVARARNGDVCITETGPGKGLRCTSQDLLAERGALLIDFSARAGLVPDGVTRARSGGVEVDVENNVFLLPSGASRIELLTPSGWKPLQDPRELGVLGREQTGLDVLPIGLRSAFEVQGLEVDFASTRSAAEVDGVRYWVAATTGRVCLLTSRYEGRCALLEQFDDQGAVVFEPNNDLGPDWTRLAGVAPDGYSTARIGNVQVPITNNVFAFRERTVGASLTIEGAGMSSRSTALGIEPALRRMAPGIDLDRRERVSTIRADGSDVTLFAAPRPQATSCVWAESADVLVTSICPTSVTPPSEVRLEIRDPVLGGSQSRVAIGTTGSRVASVEFDLLDGNTTRGIPKQGYLIVVIPTTTPLVRVRLRDSSDGVLQELDRDEIARSIAIEPW